MKLNERQYNAAVDFMFSTMREQGVSDADIDAELNSLNDTELSELAQNAFVEMKRAAGSSKLPENPIGAAALGAADTQAFGHVPKIAGQIGATVATELRSLGGADIPALPHAEAAKIFEEEFEDSYATARIASPGSYLVGQIGGYLFGLPKRLLDKTIGLAGGATAKMASGVIKSATQAGVAGAAFGAAEGALRPDRGVVEGALVGGVAGAALPLVGGGGRIAYQKTKEKITGAGAKGLRAARTLSSEASEVFDNMDELVKAQQTGFSLQSKAQATADEVGEKFGTLLRSAKERAQLSFDETQFASGKSIQGTISGLIDETAEEVAQKASKINGFAKADLMDAVVSLDQKLATAGRVLSHNYDDVLTPTLRQADEAGIKLSVDKVLDNLVAALPEGAVINGKANPQILGKQGASTLNVALRTRGKPLSANQLNNFKKAIGESVEWSDEALGAVNTDGTQVFDDISKNFHRALRDTYTGLRDTLTEGLTPVNPNVSQIFDDYHNGLKMIGKTRSVFSRPRPITENYASQLEFALAIDDKALVKPLDNETRALLKHGLVRTREVIDTQKLQTAQQVRSALTKAPQDLKSLETVVGQLRNRRQLEQLIDQQQLHPKLQWALKNPTHPDSARLASEYLAKAPEAANIYNSIQSKLAKAARLKDLGPAASAFKDVRAAGVVNPELTQKAEELVSLIPDLQRLFKADKLAALEKSEVFKEIIGSQGAVKGAFIGEGAMAAFSLPPQLRMAVRATMGILTLNRTIANPLYLQRLNSELRLGFAQGQLEQIAAKVHLYNTKIMPALQGTASSTSRE